MRSAVTIDKDNPGPFHRVGCRKRIGTEMLEVRAWCEQNCKGIYYVGSSGGKTYMKFELESDAFLFALKWS